MPRPQGFKRVRNQIAYVMVGPSELGNFLEMAGFFQETLEFAMYGQASVWGVCERQHVK